MVVPIMNSIPLTADFSALNRYVECVESFTEGVCGQQAALWYGEYVKRIMWAKEGFGLKFGQTADPGIAYILDGLVFGTGA